MPVNVPDGLPAIDILREESVFLMTTERAQGQDIRPLEIALVNLMPTKIDTETQLLRLLSNTPLQINLSLVSIAGHSSKNTAAGHMDAFYVDSLTTRLAERRFDGLIVTGAPVETLPFENVTYWNELTALFEWSRKHVFSSLFICWGANAALWHFHQVKKILLEKKLFGVYPLECYDLTNRLFIGLDNPFFMPQSRFATASAADARAAGLLLLAGSDECGAVVTATPNMRQIFITGHPEYDALTLDAEYRRDQNAGLNTALPVNYYPNNNPSCPPMLRWRTYAHQLFANWLNYCVYQETPFKLDDIGDGQANGSEDERGGVSGGQGGGTQGGGGLNNTGSDRQGTSNGGELGGSTQGGRQGNKIYNTDNTE